MVSTQRWRRIALLAAAPVLLTSSIAAADGDDLGPQAGSFSLGVSAGVFLPDSDAHDFYFHTNDWQPLNSVGPAMGLRVSYDPLRYLGFEVEGEVVPLETDTMNQAATLLGWRAQVIGQLPGRLTPFVLLGLGTIGVVSADDALGDDNDLTQHIGAGAKFYLSRNMSVRVDGRWLLAPKVERVIADDDSVSHFLLTTSLSWTFGGDRTRVERDADRDGVIGAADKCPFEAGVAPDGCPAVADRDGDGVLDAADRCPDEPEVVDGVDDADGCPEEAPDRDGDGVADRADKCPDTAEDMDSFQDEDGCLDADNDGDGLADAADGCPLLAGPADIRGCPDKDGDGDGLADRFDNCPSESGSAENRGCQDRQLVALDQTEIKILESIQFANGKATIRARSNRLLDNLARVLNAHPEITRVTVEGHTDAKGAASANQTLSRRRAQAVVDYVTARGVSASRFEAIGRGEESPIADNATARGRAENRRVELRIERAPPSAR